MIEVEVFCCVKRAKGRPKSVFFFCARKGVKGMEESSTSVSLLFLSPRVALVSPIVGGYFGGKQLVEWDERT